MKRNVFSLERVLNFRREAEKLRKIEFAEARREFENAEERLRREEETVDRLSLEFMGRQLEGISALEMQLYSDYFRGKKHELARQRDEVCVLDRAMLEKQEILREAVTDKKIMEELKKKKLRQHERTLAEKEQAFLDEIALRARGKQA